MRVVLSRYKEAHFLFDIQQSVFRDFICRLGTLAQHFVEVTRVCHDIVVSLLRGRGGERGLELELGLE
jgi:hypothetical protein